MGQCGRGRLWGGGLAPGLGGGLESLLYVLPRVDLSLAGASLLHGHSDTLALEVDESQQILVWASRHDSKGETCTAKERFS